MDIGTAPDGDASLVVTRDGAVLTVTLNRPDHRNALTTGMLEAFECVLDECNDDDVVRVVRVRGAGAAFCAGYDLAPSFLYAQVSAGVARGDSLADLGESSIARDRERMRRRIDRWLRIWNYRKPIVAQVHGYCLSGALDLIGACDIVYAADDALFGHPAARGVGIPITLGMLPLRIGAAATKELLFTGDLITADEAHRLGLAQRVFDAESLDAKTMQFCQRVALNSLDALTIHKHVTNRWLELAGARVAVSECAEYDAIFHMSNAMREFTRRTTEDGLASALAWRDGAYRDGPAADHDARHRR